MYAFFIRWVYNTGEKSASYHIPGRAAQGSDLSGTSGRDALENQDYVTKKQLENSIAQLLVKLNYLEGKINFIERRLTDASI